MKLKRAMFLKYWYLIKQGKVFSFCFSTKMYPDDIIVRFQKFLLISSRYYDENSNLKMEGFVIMTVMQTKNNLTKFWVKLSEVQMRLVFAEWVFNSVLENIQKQEW